MSIAAIERFMRLHTRLGPAPGAATVKATPGDSAPARYRPLIVIAEGQADAAYAMG
ncbi:MAG: hypothetical protein LBL48_10105 [Azoarcus sp.]|nr:hypothetical protein [Azoarcus sp.]